MFTQFLQQPYEVRWKRVRIQNFCEAPYQSWTFWALTPNSSKKACI